MVLHNLYILNKYLHPFDGNQRKRNKAVGRQAQAYSRGNIFVDGFHLSEVIKRSGVTKNHRVLDIATGAGFLALEFAKTAEMVVGSDITPNMLFHACEKQRI